MQIMGRYLKYQDLKMTYIAKDVSYTWSLIVGQFTLILKLATQDWFGWMQNYYVVCGLKSENN